MRSTKSDPVYAERRTYRRRRMADAARFLPYLGALLFVFPVVWTGPEVGTGRVIIYLFAVWAGLCVLSVFLSRDLDLGDPDETQTPDSAPPREAGEDAPR